MKMRKGTAGGKRRPRAKGKPEPSAESQVSAFLAKFDPAIVSTARAARMKLRRLLPGAAELVYDNYNALAIGFGPTERASEVIASIALFPRWVSVFFMRGVDLPDPGHLLKGAGTRVRHIVLETAGTLDEPAVKALVRAAVARHPLPLPGGRRRVIVKSVSARQRPRRPPAPRAAGTRHRP